MVPFTALCPSPLLLPWLQRAPQSFWSQSQSQLDHLRAQNGLIQLGLMTKASFYLDLLTRAIFKIGFSGVPRWGAEKEGRCFCQGIPTPPIAPPGALAPAIYR